jgi:prevent-host-death family protein
MVEAAVKTVKASEFKAKCLALLDEVQSTGEPLEVTKRGKPVARIVPPPARAKSIFGAMKGEIKVLGDIVTPLDEPWDCERQ